MKRRVCQIQYTHWPDQGTPPSTEEISKILDKKKKKNKSKPGSPTIVDCRAGIGRAGTFFDADLLIKKMNSLISELQTEERKADEVSKEEGNQNLISLSYTPLKLLKQIVWKLREQRCGMVQTEEQYKFAYQIFKDKLVSEWSKVHLLQKIKEDSSRGPYSERFKVSYAHLQSNEIEHFVGPEPVLLSSCSTINVKS